ncbi:MAG: mechanosensitive ion channel family protein [Acidimicrobiia bacterium]|nr:mechanosensitive ion channel family protein [Acidimicrobiia bacterium]
MISSSLLAATDPAALQNACGDNTGWLCEQVFDWTGSKRWARVAEWFVAKPLTILVIIIGAALAAIIVRWMISRSMNRLLAAGSTAKRGGVGNLRRRTSEAILTSGDSSQRTEARLETLTAVFRSIGTALVWFIALFFILEVLGISLGPLLATAGIVGVALGFGTQTMVRDFISGFFIVAEDQFGVGDTIDVGGGAKGIVERITLRATHIRDPEGTMWHVANGQIVKVANKSQEWARALIDVVLPYDADINAISDVMQEVADAIQADAEWSGQIMERAEIWGIQEFDSDGVHVRMVIKTEPAAQFGVLRELRARLKETFDERGISFAYAGAPTQVVLTEQAPPKPPPPSAAAKAHMPPSDGVGIGSERHIDAGFGADGDAD